MSKRVQNIENEVKELISQGVPIVKTDIIDRIYNLELNEKNTDYIKYLYEYYLECIDKLFSIDNPRLIKDYLLCLKKYDIRNNQVVEAEDPFLIDLYGYSRNKSAIDILVRDFDKDMSKKTFISIHDKLLDGTSSHYKSIRTNNTKYVGCVKNGVRKISYFPLDAADVDTAIDKLLPILNDKETNNEVDAIDKSIKLHALIAGLQLFNDGNTRYARLIQNVNLWGRLNKIIDKKIDLPLVYPSEQYLLYREEYRDLITKLVSELNSDIWNNWVKFNLTRIEDTLSFNDDKLNTLKLKEKLRK